MHKIILSFVTVFALYYSTDAAPSWANDRVLTISGLTSNGDVHLSLEDLKAIKVHKMETSTPWTEGVKVFRGIPARDLTKHLNATGQIAVASALNDYSVEIPLSDFVEYDVLIAWEMDGKRLTVRDKGPLWIVYPLNDNPEVGSKAVQARWVWQLSRLEFQ